MYTVLEYFQLSGNVLFFYFDFHLFVLIFLIIRIKEQFIYCALDGMVQNSAFW